MIIPKSINQAVIAIWVTIAIGAVVAIIEKQMGSIGSIVFGFYLFLNGISCVVPYKISMGSNPARYIFAIITVTGFLFMLGGTAAGMMKLDIVLSILSIPINIFIIYRLFSGEASNWFLQPK
ncbi:MAG: hypothetical protein ABL903_02960 [Methylococcales bacterium]